MISIFLFLIGLHFDSNKSVYDGFFSCLFKTHLALRILLKKSSILQKKISMYITLDVVTSPDIECGVCSSENVVSGVSMGHHNTRPSCFDSATRMKINWSYVLIVFHQRNAMVVIVTCSKSPRENVHARFRYQEYPCMRAVPVSNVKFDNIVNQNASSPWRP